jgi:hypothetical protein
VLVFKMELPNVKPTTDRPPERAADDFPNVPSSSLPGDKWNVAQVPTGSQARTRAGAERSPKMRTRTFRVDGLADLSSENFRRAGVRGVLTLLR